MLFNIKCKGDTELVLCITFIYTLKCIIGTFDT